MKTILIILFAGLLAGITCVVMKSIFATRSLFSFSVPIISTTTEIRATLPPGRYAVVMSTNYSAKVFGVIPHEPDYTARVSLSIKSQERVLVQGTNVHYSVFSLDDESAGEIRVLIEMEDHPENERLLLHLGRGF